jgi:ectoine hydroxylase-related dioxygenase (phytanoyl-CoA dioxygenase family)
VSAAIREVTAAEAAFYREHGWVKLERLVAPDDAAELLSVARGAMRRAGGTRRRESYYEATGTAGKAVLDIGFWQDYHYIARDDRAEPFVSLVFSREMGRNAQRLLGRSVPMRYSADLLACKVPLGHEGESTPTIWHQDFPGLPFDRVGSLSFWLALDEVTPEQGAMRFLSGSQREGPLGRTIVVGTDLLEVYPELLERYAVSEELCLEPGDATVHNAAVVHYAPANTTDRDRWAYIFTYFPGDTLYTGAQNHNFDDLGLQPNRPIEHPRFPQVYP